MIRLDPLVPITFLLVVAFIVRTVLVNRTRQLTTLWQTVQSLSRQDDPRIDPAVLRRLTVAADPRRTDLRKAILWAVTALAIGGTGWLAPFAEPGARQLVWSLTIPPVCLALVHLAFWRFWYADVDDR